MVRTQARCLHSVVPLIWIISCAFLSVENHKVTHLVCCDARPAFIVYYAWFHIDRMHVLARGRRTHQYHHSIFIVVGMCARLQIETKRNESIRRQPIYWRFSFAISLRFVCSVVFRRTFFIFNGCMSNRYEREKKIRCSLRNTMLHMHVPLISTFVCKQKAAYEIGAYSTGDERSVCTFYDDWIEYEYAGWRINIFSFCDLSLMSPVAVAHGLSFALKAKLISRDCYRI